VHIALTTTNDRAQAERIAHALLEQRLAACVSIVNGVHSIYRWQEAIESAMECLLIIKTTGQRIAAVRTLIHELHSYEVPEFVVLEAADASSAYLAWIAASVR
jgi:periplasmic divalent cation tolerance protein